MKITFVDDSFAFDGFSPASQPLNGPEKAFALLPSALAMRGHTVEVFNRCEVGVNAMGAQWRRLEDDRPAETDALVAFRQPRLIEFVANAKRRVLWTGDWPEKLDDAVGQAFLGHHRPAAVMMSYAQRDRWANPLGLDAQVVAPGLAPSFLEDEVPPPVSEQIAVSTAHPLAGLDWLLRLWVEQVRPAVPRAELHLYSHYLDRGRSGDTVPADVAPILEQAQAAAAQGVVIKKPLADPGMAQAYRRARAYLHPGFARECVGMALAESIAAGLPVVARPVSPVVAERVTDGQTGTIALNDEAFAAAAVQLLSDRITYERLADNCRLLKRGRTWAVAASEWESLLG